MGLRTGTVRMGAAIASFLLGGASLFGVATNPAAVTSQNRLNKPIRRWGRYQPGGRARSKYRAHQGAQEIARRKRQIDEGRLQITGESDLMRTIRLTRKGIERVLGEEAA